jgi:two-component system, chemotaxis family, CheB/CheR fusion protein
MPARKSQRESRFPIVAVGSSAGGLEAFTELLRALPESPGAAFIYLQHQEAGHTSMLTQILARQTAVRVTQVSGGEKLQADTIFVVPADGQAIVESGVLRLAAGGKASMPIDTLFYSLAEDQGSRAIGVVLSGTASDGSLGSRAIKNGGGIVFAQDESAGFDGMPRNAVASGAVDFVLSPAAIANEIVRIARHFETPAGRAQPAHLPKEEMETLFALLHQKHDNDFTHYKPNTIERRVRRRMAINKVETLPAYLKRIGDDPAELDLLYSDMLIRVTNFFRDADVFEALKAKVIPRLMDGRADDNALRVWVPGCASGEEVYSLAIALLEGQAAGDFRFPLQIFGTDISDVAVDFARLGVYPASALAELSPERLRRFFTKADDSYRVNKLVRDCCIFARQNVTKDPPFSKLDLISCRNVLIYLGSALQRNVVSVFHYALRPDGYLLLGNSETIGSFTDLFDVVDREHKIYRKKASLSRVNVEFETSTPRKRVGTAMEDNAPPYPVTMFREADRLLLQRFAPAGVIIDEAMDILQFRGHVSAFIEPASGTATFNVLKMAREGLLADLRSAIQAAKKDGVPARHEGVRIRNNDGVLVVNIEVIPFLSSTQERLQLVVFEEAGAQKPAAKSKGKAKPGSKKDVRPSARLQRELEATRDYLQSIIEEQETMNEEMRSANDEIQSSNEELQSTNEELETAKEELQSSNEELTTLNEELENRNQELAQVNDDLINLLGAVEIPIVILDGSMRVRRFNAAAERTIKLVPSDIGRPLNDLKTTLVVDDLDRLVGNVIATREVTELEVADRGGRRYSLRICPYQTSDNKIDGAVLVLV